VVLFVREAKGRKDRITVLSQKLKKLLEEYLAEYKPKKYLGCLKEVEKSV